MKEFESNVLKATRSRLIESKAKIDKLKAIGGRLDIAAASGIASAEIKTTIDDLTVLLDDAGSNK